MIKKIIFDMDGTIADLYNVKEWLKKLQSEDSSPYSDAEPMIDMESLNEILNELQAQGWIIAITSWLAKNSTQEYKEKVRNAKKEWIKKYNLPIQEMHLVQYGTRKQKCTKADLQILFDDSQDVRKSFRNYEKGRLAVDPQKVNIIEYLQTLLD